MMEEEIVKGEKIIATPETNEPEKALVEDAKVENVTSEVPADEEPVAEEPVSAENAATAELVRAGQPISCAAVIEKLASMQDNAVSLAREEL